MYSLRECDNKPINGKESQEIIHWQWDYSIVSKKSCNKDGEKGIAVMQGTAGTHLPPLEVESRCQQNCRP
jgi:hypothetical protein